MWNFSLALALLVSWLIIYIATTKELIKRRNFIKYTLISPALAVGFLAVLFIIKPNFHNIFEYVAYIDWEQYSSPTLWLTTLQQVFLTTGIGSGIFMTFASYNDFNRNEIRGAVCTLTIVAFIINVSVGILFAELAGIVQNDVQQTNSIPKTPAEVQLLYFNLMYYLPAPQVWMSLVNLLFIITGTVSVQLYLEVLFVTLKDNFWGTKWKNRFIHLICCSILLMVSLMICLGIVSALLEDRHKKLWIYVFRSTSTSLTLWIPHLTLL